MKTVFKKIWKLAAPYLNTRNNLVHTRVSLKYAQYLLKKEGGDEDIVIPAIILHDVGYKRLPDRILRKAWGPKKDPKFQRMHEVEGVKISKKILKKVGYENVKMKEILEIVDRHDTRKYVVSINDMIVKDADKLYRFSREAFKYFLKIFNEPSYVRLRNISKYQKDLFTKTAIKIAKKELKDRKGEKLS
jgi:HD superfamily phosphodiesterase